MKVLAGMRRFRAALVHWGFSQYFFLGVLWFVLSMPLYMAGWGVASIVSLPLLLLISGVASYVASVVFKPLPRPVVQPKPGFPRVVEHSILGTFVMSSYSNERYERTIAWNGSPTQLCLSVEGVESIAKVMLAAAALLESSAALDRQVTEFIVKKLLPNINLEWKGPDDPELAASELLRTISLDSITVHPDTTYEFLYKDGDLLGGHWIEVRGNLASGPIEVDTPG